MKEKIWICDRCKKQVKPDLSLDLDKGWRRNWHRLKSGDCVNDSVRMAGVVSWLLCDKCYSLFIKFLEEE